MKLTTLIISLFIFLCLSVFSQTTTIPDANFEQALIDQALDDVLDGQVLTSNVNSVDWLNVDASDISDLTGIEDFVSLTHLFVRGNALTEINITQNTALISFWCGDNQLTSIDVSQNLLLANLRCSDNALASLDVSQNTALTFLDGNNNPLGSLDVTNNAFLTNLYCNNTGLTGLDISQNSELIVLHCANNQLTSLDFSQNPDIITLECNDNQLTSLTPGNSASMSLLFCQNNQLSELETGGFPILEGLLCSNNNISSLELNSNCLQGIICQNNQLSVLDLSASTTLGLVDCAFNENLTYVDVRNSDIVGLLDFFATDNPNLNCIIVNDSTAFQLTDWEYDAETVTIVESMAACNLTVGLEDSEAYTQILVYPNPAIDEMKIETNTTLVWDEILIYNMQGQSVKKIAHQETIDVSALNSGMYWLIMFSNRQQVYAQTFLKE